jgi:hypothetical protein
MILLCRPAGSVAVLGFVLSILPVLAAAAPDAAAFHARVQPLLEKFCFDCHGDGAHKGNVAFDQFESDEAILANRELWFKALKNLRAGLMPPARKPQPNLEQKTEIVAWIKSAVFQAEPQNPDPGRVTVRRLNRVEYRNTIRDLMGIDFDTEKAFPPDDSGYGFDTISDVLTLPPIVLEKYLAAANAIVAQAVPAVSALPVERTIPGRAFHGSKAEDSSAKAPTLSYYEAASLTNLFHAEHGGRYEILLDFTATEHFVENQFDHNKCQLVFRADDEPLFEHEFGREGTKAFHYEFSHEWSPGDHPLVIDVQPLTPEAEQVRSLSLRIDSVNVRGPLERKFWVRPKNYERFFPKPPPEDRAGRREYAREILEGFATKAYRRPVDGKTLGRLVKLAEATDTLPGKTFEAGVSQAMVAVLASPRFLFREEGVETGESLASAHTMRYPLIDEYALATRLSYFLWSSMPDDELRNLAAQQALRSHLAEQIQRMLTDAKGGALVHNFVGQWLQVRDIDTVEIDARQVLARDGDDPEQERRRTRFRELRSKEQTTPLTPEEKKEVDELREALFRRPRPPRAELTGELRRALRQETEKMFEHVLREDRSVLELLDSDYTYLNERLAAHYGLTNLNIIGPEMRLVKLPPDSPRGGIITDGSILAVTSNPTRTSPVKRGLFILDNILGTPPPPPPPNLPPLEEAAQGIKDRTPTLRETLAIHRREALCSSCHDRMDPLGLALENFNALGMWRDQERHEPIDATGQLLTGESFTNVKELKHILATRHAEEFYRTLTEKLLTYALGRGLDYSDVATTDAIVARLKESNGRASVLLDGVIESAPFQKTRARPPGESRPEFSATAMQRADARINNP